ncbi:MAG: hypothetical protein N3A66_05495 [Planctomycetota bacterium]|nr:hypothetical protein [Planctomycetota bacterium]
MTPESAPTLRAQLVAAGQRAAELEKRGEWDVLEFLLEYMDSLWDRMPQAERDQAIADLQQVGLRDLAARIAAERENLR